MKSWHVQEKDGEHQQIVFAEKRHEAIQKSEAREWADYIDVRAKRAKYADGLHDKPAKFLTKAQLENGWWFECSECGKHQTIDDKPVPLYAGGVICIKCIKADK